MPNKKCIEKKANGHEREVRIIKINGFPNRDHENVSKY